MKIIFYLVCFFPFVDWFRLGGGTDVQPYSLIVSFLFILNYGMIRKIKLNKKIVRFYVLIIVGLIIGTIFTIFIDGFKFDNTLRFYATYISLICVSLYSYLLCKKIDGFDEKIIKAVINIYLIVGIIQKYINSRFLYEIVSNARTSSSRGVVSLASEPSFYGYMCIFFLIYAWNLKKNKWFYVANLIFQILFISKSAITLLYLAILFGIWFMRYISKLSLKKISLLIACISVILIVGYYMLTSSAFEGQRIVFLIRTLLTSRNIPDAIYILLNDQSIWERWNAIFICVKGFVTSLGIPQGFAVGKISSGFGTMLLTMGWFGLLIIIEVFRIIRNAYTGDERKIIPLFLIIIMFSAIQVSNPIFSFTLGYYMYINEKMYRKD